MGGLVWADSAVPPPCSTVPCQSLTPAINSSLQEAFLLWEKLARKKSWGIPVLCAPGKPLDQGLEALLGSIPCFLNEAVTPGCKPSLVVPGNPS